MGKTVTTYLLDSDPKGTQYVFISNKICQMYVIPRSNISILNERGELQTPAFYILLGEDDSTNPKAYIGETENFCERVIDHDRKKGFWQKALVFISKDAAMTKADVQYLEYKAIAEAKKSKTFKLDENKQTPQEPHLPEYRKDDIEEFFEDVKFLTSFVGCSIFDIIKPEHLFFLRRRGCNASGFYSSNGFTVLENSLISKSSVPSLSWKDKRDKMLKECTDFYDSNFVRLLCNKTFKSPSTAAGFCIGNSSNGWIEWKDKDGNTLDAIYRNN